MKHRIVFLVLLNLFSLCSFSQILQKNIDKRDESVQKSTESSLALKKVALCEVFTSTTCPPCASWNPQFDTWYRNYPNKNNVAVIKYHVWWPAIGDPFYAANKQDVADRRNYYVTPAVPYLYIDGSYNNSYSQVIPAIITAQNNFDISVTGYISITGGTVNIIVKTDGTAIPNGTLVLHTALVESDLKYTGSNGDPVHQFVMRKMFPSSSGETFSITPNSTKTFQRNIAWDPSWNLANSYLVTFIQVNETKYIVQSGMVSLKVTNIDENKNEVLSNFSLSQNYPNPFNPNTQIEFSLPVRNHVLLGIYNVLGNEIEILLNKTLEAGNHHIGWEPKNLCGGVYFYKIIIGNYNVMKKMLYLK